MSVVLAKSTFLAMVSAFGDSESANNLLDYINAGGSPPGGIASSIQVNNGSGGFSGDPGLTWDGLTLGITSAGTFGGNYQIHEGILSTNSTASIALSPVGVGIDGTAWALTSTDSTSALGIPAFAIVDLFTQTPQFVIQKGGDIFLYPVSGNVNLAGNNFTQVGNLQTQTISSMSGDLTLNSFSGNIDINATLNLLGHTLYGNSIASGNLILSSTSNATTGAIEVVDGSLFLLDTLASPVAGVFQNMSNSAGSLTISEPNGLNAINIIKQVNGQDIAFCCYVNPDFSGFAPLNSSFGALTYFTCADGATVTTQGLLGNFSMVATEAQSSPSNFGTAFSFTAKPSGQSINVAPLECLRLGPDVSGNLEISVPQAVAAQVNTSAHYLPITINGVSYKLLLA